MALATRRVRRNRSVGNKLNDIESRVVAAEKKTIQESSIGSTQIATEGVAKENVKDRAIASEKIEIGAINTEHLGQVNGISSGGDFAINVGEEGHVTLNGTLYTTPYDSLTDTSDLYTLGFDPTSSKVVVYPDVPVTALTQASQNYLINGGFDFWQRGTSFTADGYCADRWYFNETGVCTVTQVTTALPAGFNYALQAVASAASTGDLHQALESSVVIPLRGKTVTFSCYLKMDATMRGLGGAFELIADYSTATDARASQTTAIGTVTIDKSLYTDWARASYTFTVPSDAVGLEVGIEPPSAGLAASTYSVTGAMLEVGSTATEFRTNSPNLQAELAACQRYYYRITNPAASTNAIASGAYYSTTACYVPIRMPVTMRVAPTFARSGTVGNFLVLAGGTSRAATATAQYGTVSTDVVTINVTTAAATAGQGAWLETATSGAWLEFSSEL
jgi:hypothetical protein